MVSITPFGASGPYRDYAGGDLISLAAGGLLYLCGPPDRASGHDRRAAVL